MTPTPRHACLGITRGKLWAAALILIGYGLASWTTPAPEVPPVTVTREIVLSGGRPLLRTCLHHPAHTTCTYREERHHEPGTTQ